MSTSVKTVRFRKPRPAGRSRPWVLMAPLLIVIIPLFVGATALALAQSLSYLPIAGLDRPNLDAYQQLLSDSEFWSSLLLTFYIAATATLISVALGLATALLLRSVFARSRRFSSFLQINLPIPHLVGALAVLHLVGPSGLVSRIANAIGLVDGPAALPALVFDSWSVGIIAEYVWKEVPFIALVALGILGTTTGQFEAVASSLGARRWQRFRHVTLPVLAPGIVPATLIVFAFAFGTFEVPLLLGRSFPSALPVLAYRKFVSVDIAARPEAMAIGMVITLVVAISAVAYLRLSARYLRRP